MDDKKTDSKKLQTDCKKYERQHFDSLWNRNGTRKDAKERPK